MFRQGPPTRVSPESVFCPSDCVIVAGGQSIFGVKFLSFVVPGGNSAFCLLVPFVLRPGTQLTGQQILNISFQQAVTKKVTVEYQMARSMNRKYCMALTFRDTARTSYNNLTSPTTLVS